MGYKRYAIGRLLSSFPIMIGVTFVSFSLLYMSGNPVVLLLGDYGTPTQIAITTHQLGLDKPVPIQYLLWLERIFEGDMGASLLSKLPVIQLVEGRLIATLLLTVSALIVGVSIGILAGLLSALYHRKWGDYMFTFFALFWISMPYFWFAMLLVLVFGVYLGLFPVAGSVSLGRLILPAVALGLPQAAIFTRITRSSMLEVIGQDYVRTARAKGLHEPLVLYKHALRNALLPVFSLVILRIPWLIGGAFITETIFAWPGMGTLLVDAIYKRDFPVVQGIVFVITLLVVLSSVLGDLAIAAIDPRIKYD